MSPAASFRHNFYQLCNIDSCRFVTHPYYRYLEGTAMVKVVKVKVVKLNSEQGFELTIII